MVIWLLALACEKDPETDDSSTPIDDSTSPADDSGDSGEPVTFEDLAGSCANGTALGRFEVSHTSFGFPLIYGDVLEAPLPTSELTALDEQGGCHLWRRENPFCDPPCTDGQTCDLEGQCIDFPLRVGVGTVAFTGTTEPSVIEETEDRTYWDEDAEAPLFEPGAAITMTATGKDAIPPFELHGFGVDPLTLAKEKWVMEGGVDMVVEWTPGKHPSQIWLSLAIDQHGITPVTMYCEVDDTGSLTVPGSFIETLVTYGVSGFPAAYIHRRTIDSVDVPGGCIELTVGEQLNPLLAVEGHTPCFGDFDCPKGQVCNVPTQTCVDE